MKSILFFLLFPILVSAQELKKIREKNKNNGSVETFSVLKSDQDNRQGEYSKVNSSGQLIIKGSFNNNAPAGVWEYYSEKGKLQMKYDRTKRELIYADPTWDKSKKYKVIINSDTIETILDHPVLFLGNDNVLMEYLWRNLRYPAAARENGIEGTVVISFIVDEKGNASSYKVKRDVGGGCGEEALRVVSSFPYEWIPAEKDGKPVSSIHYIPVTFQLSSK